MTQLHKHSAFREQPMTEQQSVLLKTSLARIAVRHQQTCERELHALDVEIRRSLTMKQLRQINDLIGERRLVEGPELELAILRLQTIDMPKPQTEVSEKAMVLGRSMEFELSAAGALRPVPLLSASQFFFAFRNALTSARIDLSSDQSAALLELQNDLLKTNSERTRQIAVELVSEKISPAEARLRFQRQMLSQIHRILLTFDTLLSARQQDLLDDYVFRRDINQRGMLAVLIDGERVECTDQQREAWKKLAQSKITAYRELLHTFEAEIWTTVVQLLPVAHRRTWKETLGSEPSKLLPAAPSLLLHDSTMPMQLQSRN